MQNAFSLARTKVNSSTSNLRFSRDFLARSEAHKNAGLDFKSLWIVGTGSNFQIKLHFLLHTIYLTSNYSVHITEFFVEESSKRFLSVVNE